MNLRKLIDSLPYYFKENDTYKVNDEGILERFLDICGNYLQDQVTKDIDEELNRIDLNLIPEMYLNYIWEFLGEIPFAYTVNIDRRSFYRYYNGLKTDAEIQQDSVLWTIPKKGIVVLSTEQVREVLKYAITLIKCRGTERFYRTLFEFYGFNCVIEDPTKLFTLTEVLNYLERNDVDVNKTTNGNIVVTRNAPYDAQIDDPRFVIESNIVDIWTDTDLQQPYTPSTVAISDEMGNIVAYYDTQNSEWVNPYTEDLENIMIQYQGWYKAKPLYDSLEYLYDKAKYDIDPRCTQCIPVHIDISSIEGFEPEIEDHPDDEIWYTTDDGNIFDMETLFDTLGSSSLGFTINNPIISNTYSNGKGILKFTNPVTSLGEHFNQSLDPVFWPISGSIDNLPINIPDNLVSVILPNTVTYIYVYAFGQDPNGIEFHIPGVTGGGNNSKLETLVLSSNLTTLYSGALFDCPLTSLELPTSITTLKQMSIAHNVSSTIKLGYITYQGTIAQFNNIDKDTEWYYCYDTIPFNLPYVKCIDGDCDLQGNVLPSLNAPMRLGGLMLNAPSSDPTVVYLANDQITYATNNLVAISNKYIPNKLDKFIDFRTMIVKFLDRYLPYNVRYLLTIHGMYIDDGITITMEDQDVYDVNFPHTIFLGKHGYVRELFTVSSLWPNSDLRFTISTDGTHWSEPYLNGSTIDFTIAGTYYIRPVDPNFIGNSLILVVDSVRLSTWYTVDWVVDGGGGTELSPSVRNITIKIRGIKHVQEYTLTPGGTGQVVTSTEYVPVSLIQGSAIESQPQQNWQYYTFTENESPLTVGVQEAIWCIDENPSNTTSIHITRAPEYATGSIDPSEDFITKYPFNPVIGSTRVLMEAHTNYSGVNYGDYLQFKSTDIPNLVIPLNGTWLVDRDLAHFYIDRIITGDPEHDARARAIIIEHNPPTTETKFEFKATLADFQVYLTTNPEGTIYKKNPYNRIQVRCGYNGKLPSNIPYFDDRVLIYRDGVYLETVDAFKTAIYLATRTGVYTFESHFNPNVKSSVGIIDEPHIIPSRLVIKPLDPDDSNWETDWETVDPLTNVAYAIGPVKVAPVIIVDGHEVHQDIWLNLINPDYTVTDLGHFSYGETPSLDTKGTYVFRDESKTIEGIVYQKLNIN